jgi:hypothetical protein
MLARVKTMFHCGGVGDESASSRMVLSRNRGLQVRWLGALLRSACLLALVNLSDMKLKN